METLLNLSALLPLAFILVMNLVFVVYGMTLLRIAKILKHPFAGMEYAEAVTAAAFMFSVVLITSAVTPAVFETYKTYYYSLDNVNWLRLSIIKFSHILLVLAFFHFVFILLLWFASTVMVGLKKLREELSTGNLPLGLLFSAAITGLAITVRLCCSAAMDEVIPQVIRIN